MRSFRDWCEEAVSKTRLAVYDFDDTLVNTPKKPEGWRGGWWGRSASLRPPLFNYESTALNTKVVEQFRKDKARADTITVMMTGRHGGLERYVREILAKYNLHPDEQYYKDTKDLSTEPNYPKGGDVWDYKSWVVKNRFMTRDGIREVDFWDDREEHIPKWMELSRWIREAYPQVERVTFHNAVTGEETNF